MGYRIDTIAAHAGGGGENPGEPVVAPLTLSTTFRQESPGRSEEHAYSRIGNPSRNALERTLATLEAGASAASFSSGCAAMHAVLQLLQPGDHGRT